MYPSACSRIRLPYIFYVKEKATGETALRVLCIYSDALFRRWPLKYVWIQPSNTSREGSYGFLPHGSAGLLMVLHSIFSGCHVSLSARLHSVFTLTDRLRLPPAGTLLPHHRMSRPSGKTRLSSAYVFLPSSIPWNSRISCRKILYIRLHFHIRVSARCSWGSTSYELQYHMTFVLAPM